MQPGGATVKSPMASYYPSSKTQNAKSSDIKKSKSCGKGLIYDFEKQKCVPEKELFTQEEQLVQRYLKDRETDPSLGIMTDPYTGDLELTSTRPAQSQFTMGPQSAGTGDAFWQAAVLGPGIAKGAASLIGRAAPYATAPLTVGSKVFPYINPINTIGLGFGAHSGANFFDSESATRQSLSKAYDNPTAGNILDATGNVTMDALGVLTSPGMGGAMTAGVNYLTAGGKNLATTSKNILSDYRNIEELRLAHKMKDYDVANKNFATLFPDKQIFDQTKKEADQLLNKYKSEFIKKFGKGTDEEVLLYGAHKDLGGLSTTQNFLADDEFAKSVGLTNDLSNQNKFLSDAYQLEFSGHFNKNPQIGDNRQFSEYLSDQFEPVITTNKLNKPVQVKRTSSFNRPVKTMREGNPEPLMLKYDELQEGDIIYPEHNWSTSSDIQGDVWGSGSPISKVARINLPAGQSTLRPNMFKGTQYANEEELVLPSKLGYKVSGINTQGFGDNDPRFIFDVVG